MISEHRSIHNNNTNNTATLRMQHSVNVTMEKRLALEVNSNKETITIPGLSTFANHLSSMISCPDFSVSSTPYSSNLYSVLLLISTTDVPLQIDSWFIPTATANKAYKIYVAYSGSDYIIEINPDNRDSVA